jgi:hypothetical protein
VGDRDGSYSNSVFGGDGTAIEQRLIRALRSFGSFIPRFEGATGFVGATLGRSPKAVPAAGRRGSSAAFYPSLAKKLLASGLLKVASLLLMMPVT